MTVLVSHNFNGLGANANLVTVPAQTGGPFVTGSGAENAFVVQTNGNLKFNGSVGNAHVLDGSADAGGYVEIITPATLAAATHRVVALRLQDINNWIGLDMAGTGATGFRVSRCVAGVITDLYQFQGTANTTYFLSDDGNTINLIVNGAPEFSFVDNTNFVSATGKGLVSIATSGTNAEIITYYESGTLTGGNSISLTSTVNNRIYQQIGGAADVTLSGGYAGTPSAIEYRLYNADTGVALTGHDWQTLDAAPTGNAFNAVVSVDAQLVHIVAEVRFSNDVAVISDGGGAIFRVGNIVDVSGQSNGEKLWTNGTDVTPSPFASLYTSAWAAATTTGNGINTLLNELISATGVPWGAVLSAVGGTGLTAGAVTPSSNYWSNPNSTLYTAMLTRIEAVGGAIAVEAFIQGEKDARASIAGATYETAETLMFNQMRTDIGNASGQAQLPIVCPQLGRGTLVSDLDVDFQAIRDAQQSVANTMPGVYSVDAIDLAMLDDIHHTNAAYIISGQRIARAILAALGFVTTYRGPQHQSARFIGPTSIELTLLPRGGTDITPPSGITGYRVNDDGTPVTISGVARTSPTTLVITLAAATAGAVTVDYQYGSNPVVTGAVFDNATPALPLRRVAGLSVAALADITGSGSMTEGADTMTGSGSITITGAGDMAETGTDTMSGSGTVSGGDITGSGDMTDAADTISGSGSVANTDARGYITGVLEFLPGLKNTPVQLLLAGDNENVIRFSGLKNGLDGSIINDAVIYVTLTDSKGVAVDGMPWPALMSYQPDSNGVYVLQLSHALNLSVGKVYNVRIEVSAGGLRASFNPVIKAIERRT